MKYGADVGHFLVTGAGGETTELFHPEAVQ